MFPAAPAAPFARNVACRGVLVIYICISLIFKIHHVFLRYITISVTSRGSDKPVCHGGATVRYGYPRSITVINTFFYGLLCSVAVSCVLTKALHVFSVCQGQLRSKRRHHTIKRTFFPFV